MRSSLYQYIQKKHPDYVKYLEKEQRNDDKKKRTSLLRDLEIRNRNRRIEDKNHLTKKITSRAKSSLMQK